MQAAKAAVENIKETAANLGASAKSGLEKTKATIQEQTEKMGAHDQVEKDLATMRKEERINQAEMEKQLAHMQNAVAKQSALSGHMDQGLYTATGPGTQSPVIDPSGPGAVTASTNTTGTPGPENFVHSNTGLGTGTATYSTTGPGYVNVLPADTDSGATTYNSSVPGQGNILSSSSGPGAGTGSQTAAFPAADYGQTEANQGAMMPGHGTGPGLGQGIGLENFHGHGQVTDDVVGTVPTETNTLVVEAPTTLGSGSAPTSGPKN